MKVFQVVLVALFLMSSALAEKPKKQEWKDFNPETGQISIHLMGLANSGKMVAVHLESGLQIKGLVRSVKDNLLILDKIQGRDFSSAVVSIGSVIAIEAETKK